MQQLYLLALLSVASPHLNSLLKSYNTLHKDELTIKYFGQNVLLSLNIEDKNYVATLSPNTRIFHKHFSVEVRRPNGTTRLNNPTAGHFVGTLNVANFSRVSVHIEDGLVTGSIEVNNALYYIEPAWRHVAQPHHFHMILYKKSDIFYNFGHPDTGEFCGHNDSSHNHGAHDFVVPKNASQTAGSSFPYETRFKRASAQSDTCEVILVADYRFYTDIGASSELATKSFLVAIFERINRIFQSTNFETSDRSFLGYGMQIKKVLIHAAPSADPTNYNYDKNWDVSLMLDAFGYGDSDDTSVLWADYCLAHLYTNRDFDAGVLGLAYVASPISNKVGGVCSSPYISGNNNKKRMLNIGISTSLNYGRNLLSSELEIVSAHEIGHNWGSSHDPDSLDDCAPSGNYFIMYPSAVDGTRSNNKLFSPCSRSAIASVLKYKSHCFVVPSATICGNGIVEEEEDCDPGSETTDPCCNQECKFGEGAVCSDLNSECCAGCHYAGPHHVCYESTTLDSINACIAQKNCSASSTVCDVKTLKANDSVCYDEGQCFGGVCLDFCAAKGLTLCQGQGNNSCYWMCEDDERECTDKYSKLPDGKPCRNGFCEEGVCVVEPQSQTKIWSILTNLTPSLFLKWMSNNVVLVVVLFTSIFWIPLSVFVHWLDRGQDEVDYYTLTLKRKKEALKAQKSTISSRSFELRTIIPEEPAHTFTLTGQQF